MDFILNRWVQVVNSTSWSARNSHRVITANGYIYLTGGFVSNVASSEVWRSIDGSTWTLLTSTPGWGARATHGFLFYDNKMWVFGGYDGVTEYNDVWSSVDGITWNLETSSAAWGTRHKFGYCIHNNKMYISGGYRTSTFLLFSDVWSSIDGITWTLESSDFGSSIRQHSFVSFLDNIWIYGGDDNNIGPQNKIIMSEDDGVNWSVVGYLPFFRYNMKPFVNDAGDQLSLIGGSTAIANFDDNYVSTDGINITSITQVTPRPKRRDTDLVYLNKSILMFGGSTSLIQDYNDVWKEQYVVVYDANSGATPPIDYNFYDPDDIATVLSSTGMAKTWYTFNSWNTASNGSGITYNSGDTLTVSPGITTLYAQWDADTLPSVYFVESVGDNTSPYDSRSKASLTLGNLYVTLPSHAWHVGVEIHVFGAIFESNAFEWMEMQGVKIIGEDPQTTIINMSSNSLEGQSLYNCTFFTDEPDAEWNSLIYNSEEVLNCKFRGNNLWYEAIDTYDSRPQKIIGNSFEDFIEDAIYISDNSAFGDVLIINNSLSNGNIWIRFTNATVDDFHFYNNIISNSNVHIEITNTPIIEFLHDHNISTGGYEYILESSPFSPDVTEITDDPLFLSSDINNMLEIDNTSPAFHAGMSRSMTPLTDLLGVTFFSTPSIGAYEVSGKSVIYNGNGNSSGTVPVDSNVYLEGDSVTVLNNVGVIIKNDYTFFGWNTQADGLGIHYASSNVFIISTTDITLYADWFDNSLLSDITPLLEWMTVEECIITSPTDETVIYDSPTNISVDVTATSKFGYISLIEFFLDGVYQGSTSVQPYNYVIFGVANGNHVLFARATNEFGAYLDSDPISITVEGVSLECEIVCPENDHVFDTSPLNITIEVVVTSSFGNVSLVEFFVDDIKVGESSTSPFNFTWLNVNVGSYVLTARATSEYGPQLDSDPVSIQVNNTNVLPICDVVLPSPYTYPPSGNIFAKGSDILIRAEASDVDGFITKVEFYLDDGTGPVLIGEDSNSPYSFILEDVQIGTYTITAIATDNRGDESVPGASGVPLAVIEVVSYDSMSTDTTPPITTNNTSYCSNWNRRHSSIVVLTAVDYADTEHDTPSGVKAIFYTIDGSEPDYDRDIEMFDSGTIEASINFEVFGQGEIPIKFFSVDWNGNVERLKTNFLRLDDVPPVTTYTTNIEPDGSNGWFKTNPLITLHVSDDSSGPSKTFYRFNSDAFQEYSVSFNLPNQGIYTLQYYSEDIAGNIEEVNTSFIKYDFLPPETQDDVLPIIYTEPKLITFFTSDLFSGVENTYYTLDSSVPTTSSQSGSSVTVAETGVYTVTYFSVDFAGNSESIKTKQLRVFIDEDGPGIYIYESFHIDGQNGWYVSSPQISITAIDPSGIKDILYKLHPVDVTTTAIYTSTVDLSSTIDLSVYHFIRLEIDQSGEIYEIDVKGIIPSQTTISEIINSINAVTGFTIASETNINGGVGNGYITMISPTAGTSNSNSEIKFLPILSFDATQEVFGLDETEYPHTFTETVVFKSYTGSFILPSDNYWNVDFYAIDNNDNQSEIQSKKYNLDSEKPVTIVSSVFEPDGDNNWYITNPEITLSSIDNLSEVQATYYRWDEACWQQYTQGTIIQATSQGQHYLEVYSIDFAGNEEEHQNVLFKYVYSGPETTDDTINYQGIIFTARASGHQQVPEENPIILDPYHFSVRNSNVVAAPYIYNLTKTQEYILTGILGDNRNILEVLPLNRSENSTRIDDYRIQLLGLGSSFLTSLNDVLRIYNRTKGVTYSLDHNSSFLNGDITVKGAQPIDLGNVLEVDYKFSGVPLSFEDIIDVSYAYDLSHEPDVLNTLEYSLIDPLNQPYAVDYNVTIHLTPTDLYSSIVHTYYTTDDTIPTTDSLEGTIFELTEPGSYVIRYFSINEAGVIESVKKARYDITIDKRIPGLETNFVLDPLEDGENGWFKYAFGLDVELWSDDRLSRQNEDAIEASSHRIVFGQNDAIDFEETSGIELNVIISEGVYTTQELATQIETGLNSIGSYTYIVDVIDSSVSEGQAFRIRTSLSNTFSLLWATGSNSSRTISTILGFCPSSALVDFVGHDTYTSSYYKFKLNNYFIKTVQQVKTSILQKHFNFVEVLPGVDGFYDEILIEGPEALPSVIDVTQQLDIRTNKDFDYLENLPISGSLVITRDTIPLILGVDYTYDSMSSLITIIIVSNNVYEAHYSLEDKVLVDYTHYIGLQKVKFGLESTSLTTEVQIYNVPDLFTGFADDRVNFLVSLPSTPDQFFLQDGINTIYAQAYDNNSVLGTGVTQKISLLKSAPYKLDRLAPITTDNIPSYNWYKAPVSISLYPTDDFPGSGVSKTYFTTDGLTPTKSSSYGTEIDLGISGIYDIQYFSTDVAGNSEIVNSGENQIRVDAEPPFTSIIVNPIAPDGVNWWYVTQPEVSFLASDIYSGVSQTFYRINNDFVFEEYTTPFLLPTEGSVTITYYSTDNVGNIETDKVSIIKYDSIAPVTTTDAPSTGYTSNSIINFISIDTSSGVSTTYYTTDGSVPDFSSPNGSFVELPSSGTYSLSFFSVDNAGNVETIKYQEVNLDLEQPVISEFLPVDCIITDLTTEITFKISDSLSGVDITSVEVDVDGLIYSTKKNATYFSYSGTSSEYTVTISPITDLLSFQDIELLKVKNVTDFAGNIAPILEFNLTRPDVSAPWVREVYPSPNMIDVSTNTNVIAFIDDSQSGVDIRTVNISISGVGFKINSKKILNIQYTGIANSATLQIFNKSLTTSIDSVRDISISFYELQYNTIKKVQLYIDSLPGYSATIIDERFEQSESTLLLNVVSLDILNVNIVDLYLPEDNLNFSFIERGTGYLVFASPSFRFEHKVPVDVSIEASDNTGNIMETFSYLFIPHIYATPSIKKRNYLNRVALQYINDIHDNIASNYSRSRSTNFYGHHKSICLELARHFDEIDSLNIDRSYETLRPLYLYEKLGYLLETEPISGLSHEDYRLMLQSLISIFFKGSLKSSLEQGVTLLLGTDVKIIEVVFSTGSDISDQFLFTANIEITDVFTGVDLLALSRNLSHVFNLVKPAHVFIVQRFAWTDIFDFQAGCTLLWVKDDHDNYAYDQFGNMIPQIAYDGYQDAETQSDTAICDRFKYSIDSHYEEDMRQDCSEGLAEIETFIDNVTAQFSGTENFFYIYRTPVLRDSTHVASDVDIIVTVDGNEVPVENFDPLTGLVTLVSTPVYGSIIQVEYNYNPYFIYRIVTFYLYNKYTAPDSFFGGGNTYFNVETGDASVFIDGMVASGSSSIHLNGFPDEMLFVLGLSSDPIPVPQMRFTIQGDTTIYSVVDLSNIPIVNNECIVSISPVIVFQAENGTPVTFEEVVIDYSTGDIGIQTETRSSIVTREIVGRIQIPEVTMHAHVCDSNHNTINLNVNGDPYIGESYPGSIEDDPTITNPDFPGDFDRISDFKEPLILGKFEKTFSPESGTPTQSYFTYLNDSRYRLGAISLTNKLFKNHDTYTVTWS